MDKRTRKQYNIKKAVEDALQDVFTATEPGRIVSTQSAVFSGASSLASGASVDPVMNTDEDAGTAVHRHSHPNVAHGAESRTRSVTTASILRLSASQRLLVAGILSCVLWVLVYWAIS
jgi:hypothetical protein